MILPDDFFLPFGGQLNKENRWVQLAALIPWWKTEERYRRQFRSITKGQKAVSVRLALGALMIQQRLNLSDRETVRQITENPYLQYFIGLPSFQEEKPFHPSLLTHFRKRLGADAVNQVNEWIVSESCEVDSEDHDDDPGTGNGPTDSLDDDWSDDMEQNEQHPKVNQGKLLLNATCTPADIAYPTDLSLFNEAREKLEHMIDVLHEYDQGECRKCRKPRTYRRKARRVYLAVAQQRHANPKGLRKAIGQQLRFVARNLRIVAKYNGQERLTVLNQQQYRQLLVIHGLYRQQQEMYVKGTHRIEDRIVSISQPHLRPIVRGKARANVEF